MLLLASVSTACAYFFLDAHACRAIKTISPLGHGIVKQAYSALHRDQVVVIKKVFNDAVDLKKGRPFLPLKKLLYEATLFHDLHQQFPNSSVVFHGMCVVDTDEPFLVIEKLQPAKIDARRLHACLKRMSLFHAGPLELTDMKREQFGLDAKGQLHAIDLGDVVLSSHTPERAFNITLDRAQRTALFRRRQKKEL